MPAGSGWACNKAVVSTSSAMLRVAMMPAWVNRAPRVMVGVAAAAVSGCADAVRRLLCVTPVDGEVPRPHGLGGHLLMHVQDLVRVLWPGGAYLDGGAVGE